MRFSAGFLTALAAVAVIATPAAAHGTGGFDHVGTFHVPGNLQAGEPADTITSAEIVAAEEGGHTLIYTDSPAERIGFVDITKPNSPSPSGVVDIGGEPTSVATVGGCALVAVDTSESFTEPSGELAVVDTRARRVVRRLELAGQPDSVAVSPDHHFAAIVIAPSVTARGGGAYGRARMTTASPIGRSPAASDGRVTTFPRTVIAVEPPPSRLTAS